MIELFTTIDPVGLLASGAAHPEAAEAWNTGAVYTIVYCFFAALTIVSGVMLLMTADVVRAAFLLLGALAGVAGLYGLLGADFVAFVQIVVYMGGILILLLFGVMLTNRDPVLLHGAESHQLVAPGFIAAGVSLFGILYVVTSVDWHATPAAAAGESTARTIGEELMTTYLLPFEIVSVLLLIAMVGAVVIARRRGTTSEPA